MDYDSSQRIKVFLEKDADGSSFVLCYISKLRLVGNLQRYSGNLFIVAIKGCLQVCICTTAVG